MQRKLDAADAIITNVQQSASAAAKFSQDISPDIKKVIDAALAPGGAVSAQVLEAVQIPGRAIMAFSSSTDRCPKGWKAYDEAGGRMIIGAGTHSADSDEAGRVFRFEAGHPFRFESGHHSDLKVAGVALPGGLLG